MAVYKLFPTKDSTIYSKYPAKNTGLDAIMEASADYSSPIPQVSRYLIQFSQDEIDNLITDTIGEDKFYGNKVNVNLVNYIANIENLNTDTTLEVYAISGSWNMGTGRFNDTPETDNGCSWVYKTYSGSNKWSVDNFSNYVTASYGEVPGGGTWYTASEVGLSITASKTYTYTSDKDLKLNVTNIVTNWYDYSKGSGEAATELPQDLPFELGLEAFPNDGFIIKLGEDDEFQANKYKQAKLQFYSVDTNTIYPPELQFQWEDVVFDTGSSTIPIIQNSELVASLDNNPGEFRRDSVHRFKINCRPRFPSRTYQTSSIYLNQHYLPISSSYAVKDLDTNEFVIDFNDDYTRISADATSSYFDLYMKGLEPERYYQLLLKVPIDNQTLILDDNYYFKVING